MRSFFWSVLLLASSVTALNTLAGDLAALPEEFSPILQGAGNTLLQPGTIISSTNLEKYTQWLDESVADLIGAGAYQITLGSKLSFPTHPGYMDATESYSGETRIGAEPGELINYQAGRPFPNLDSDDPQAGTKAAWNMRYAYAPDETETAHFTWRYRDMAREKVERTLAMYGAILRYKHRTSHQPMPDLDYNPAQLFSALYLRVNSPQDIRNTQLLIHRADDDSEPEQAWMYLNTQRRVKRIATSQKTDAFLGSDIIDAATFAPVLVRIYDRAGKLWKLGISALSHSDFHAPENKNWQGVITDAVTMIDLQAAHCTTLNLKSRVASKSLHHKYFTEAYLRQMGR